MDKLSSDFVYSPNKAFKRNKKTLFTLCTVFITACDGGGNVPVDKIITPSEQIVELERSDSIPKLERGKSIEGIDLNANAIRDDI
ncbi:hypothetical protein PCNPT3_08560 [Psychromonas sp. CNPT3]|uniref:hypothetical protein n=1 Tax=Psychromonas sp. CNPT3 TaxID=314282 RepID=UPI00006E8AE3|nr:hypothetical protein [Psychromonas sp. CNPT3]AGH81650.1 hypothetical protein PCNPT3_08560 [Psychromonas sp. CNPT3]